MVKRHLSNQMRISIGDIRISVSANNRFKIDSNYSFFFSQGHPEVTLRSHYGYIPQIELGKKTFDNQLWDIHRSSKKVILRIFHPEFHSPSIIKLGIFQPDFKSGDIYALANKLQNGFPLNHPLGQILIISLLSRGKGILIHSCGIGNNGEGMLFVGNSGAGKSTIASLGTKHKEVKVLNDDRIIIRKLNGRFCIYGTPWHGDVKAYSPERTPLAKIFFLKHAKNNIIRKITPIEAMSRLIACSFPTYWDKRGMEFTLRFCDELAQKVPCYELGFVPDKSIIDFLREVP
jgi:hypothetical protein